MQSAAARLLAATSPRSPRTHLLLLGRGLCSASPGQPDPRPGPGPGPGPDPDPQLVGALCRVLSDFRGPRHDLRAALHAFAPRLTPAAAAAVLRRCRNLPVPSLRFFLFAAAVPGFTHLPDSLLVLAGSLAGARLFPLLRSLLSDLPRSALSRDLFPLLFRSYARASLPDDAIRAFSSMEGFGFPPTVADLHSLLFALSHNGLVEHAEAFFRDSASQFGLSAKTYTILISGWAVVTKPENARKLFDEMIERGIEHDVPAYNALIDALCRGGDVALAHEQLKDMQRRHKLVPDAATYGPFLRSACASKDARAALRVLDRMRMHDLTPNVFTYNAVIRLLCDLGEVDEAYNILNEMAARRVDRAIEVWDGMEKRGFHPGAATYAVMIHGLSCKKGRAEEACSYFLRMVDEGIPPYQATCQVLRDRLLRLGLRDDLEMLTDRMRRSTSCTIQDLTSIMCSKRADETRNMNSDHEFSGVDLDESQWREKWKIGD
ncbi:hypothetical protein GQ55_2G240300 [Panicum hallii var. hallii]|uniref:PROP1-like PPR domain-containing protein n=1 Tax=Panicum hallii var. hallii TaxID=1504633 RepID=A0A2T7ERT6_9POAL|nr:hypothetical protein GQ55_2G240300 [Panicum hallii var. hallii]